MSLRSRVSQERRKKLCSQSDIHQVTSQPSHISSQTSHIRVQMSHAMYLMSDATCIQSLRNSVLLLEHVGNSAWGDAPRCDGARLGALYNLSGEM